MNLTTASYLSLTSDPPAILPIVTTKLQVRCSIKNNTILNGAPFIDDFPLSNSTTSPSPIAAELTHTTSGNNRFLAIAIMKVNEISGFTEAVARVSGCEAPVIQRGFTNKIIAEGSSEGSTEADEQGYLLLTWDHPVLTDAGTYKCEATFLNQQSLSQTLRTSRDVPAKEPSLSDLTTYIAANSKYIASLESQVQALVKKNQDLAADVKRLGNATSGQRALTTENIQTGTASCSNQWIYFPHAFSSEPVVFTSLSSLAFQRLDYYSQSVSIQVEDVSSYGFRVNCTTSPFYTTANFDWLGIGG